MFISKALASLGLLTVCSFASPQTAPSTSYTIIEGVNGAADSGTTTIYRSGDKVQMEFNRPASGATPAGRTLTLYDLKAQASWSWDPAASPIQCNAGRFSGDWGDPFSMTAEITQSISKGELKPAGTETLAGVTTQVYTGGSGGEALKAWVDQKDGLVIKVSATAPGAPPMIMADIRRVMLTAPSPSHFALPAACAGSHPPPTPAELIAEETGDSSDNFVNGNSGPGSKDTCTIALHIVQAKTMAPITRKFQIAIDTTHLVGEPNPPAYTFGVGNDGTATYSGGGIHEVTNQVRNGVLRIVNPPPSFELALNVITPGQGTGSGGVYRQCYGPITNLYYVMKDQSDPFKGGDYLYAKSGKCATGP